MIHHQRARKVLPVLVGTAAQAVRIKYFILIPRYWGNGLISGSVFEVVFCQTDERLSDGGKGGFVLRLYADKQLPVCVDDVASVAFGGVAVVVFSLLCGYADVYAVLFDDVHIYPWSCWFD